MDLKEEKKLVADVKALKAQRKEIQDYESKQTADKLARDEYRKKREELRDVLQASDKKIDDVKLIEDDIKRQLDELRAREKDEVGDLSGLLAQKDANKAEVDAHYDQIRKINKVFREEMREWRDNDYKVRQQQREIKQAQWKKRQAEKQAEYEARKKEEEEAYEDADPYDDEKKTCDTLVNYLNRLTAKEEEKKVEKKIDYEDQVIGKKSKSADDGGYWSELKGNKKTKMQKRKKGKSQGSQVSKKILSHPLEKMNAFENLGIKIPLNPEDLVGTIEELKKKKASFDVLAKENGGKRAPNKKKGGKTAKIVNLKINTKNNGIKLTIDVL